MASERRKPRETSASTSLPKSPSKIPRKTGATSKDQEKAAADKENDSTDSETITNSLSEQLHEQTVKRVPADIVTISRPRKLDQQSSSKTPSFGAPTKGLDADTRHPEPALDNDIKARGPTQDAMTRPEKKDQRLIPIGSGPAHLNEPGSNGRVERDLEPSIARAPGGIKAKAEAKRRRILPTTNIAGQGKAFKNLAIQNRFRQHRRTEPAPNPANLVFIDPRTGRNVTDKPHGPPATSPVVDPQYQEKDPMEMICADESPAGGNAQLSAPRLEIGVTDPSKVPQVAEYDTRQQSNTIDPLITAQQIQPPRVVPSTTNRHIQPLPTKPPSTITVEPPENAPTGPMRSRAISTTLTSQHQPDKLSSSTLIKESAMADTHRSKPSYDVSDFSLMHTPTKKQSQELWLSKYTHVIAEMRLANREEHNWEVLKVKLQCINEDKKVRSLLLALKSGPSTLYMDFTMSILASEYQNYFSMVSVPLSENPSTLLIILRMHHTILEEEL